jgi:mercuric ion transport protein
VVYLPAALPNREQDMPLPLPPILDDGRHAAEAAQILPECCRVPAAASGRTRWSTTAAVLPGILATLLPRITCPACWPAYAGFLGAVGLPILMDVRWLLPLTGASLLVAVGALAVGARTRRAWAPLLVGLAAAALVLIGKFVVGSNPATYLGTVLLVCASVWNAWPTQVPR